MNGRERLLRLANVVLPNVSHDEFDMTVWDCGTVACAAGHAARDPVLAAEGLSVEWTSDRSQAATVRYQQSQGTYALERFFELPPWRAELIFLPACYAAPSAINPSDVRGRILAYLNAAERLP